MFVEDLSPFFTDFAETVEVDGVEIDAIYSSDYEVLNVHGEVESSMPGIFCKSSDVSLCVHGSIVTVRGKTYEVVEIKRNDDATTDLVLRIA